MRGPERSWSTKYHGTIFAHQTSRACIDIPRDGMRPSPPARAQCDSLRTPEWCKANHLKTDANVIVQIKREKSVTYVQEKNCASEARVKWSPKLQVHEAEFVIKSSCNVLYLLLVAHFLQQIESWVIVDAFHGLVRKVHLKLKLFACIHVQSTRRSTRNTEKR